MKTDLWWRLAAVFTPLSFLSIGGGQSILGDTEKQVVLQQHWITHGQFLDDFAIARASSGPNTMIVSLIGWQVGGLVGAIIASVAIFVPSSLLFYGVTQIWRLSALERWRDRLSGGLAPVSIGLSLGSAFAILSTGGVDWLSWCVSGACLAALLLTKVNPFILLVAGGGVFALAGLLGR